MKKIVLFSGGLDSTTCLAKAVSECGSENVIAMSMYYGQKHEKEIDCAKKLVEYYKVKHIQYDLSKIFETSDCTLLKRNDAEIPEESYAVQMEKADGKPVSTYVPFRNGLFLSVAASVALAEGADVIMYGAHKDDAAGSAYPDCSELFCLLMKNAIYEGTGKQIKLEAPYINKNKADIVADGLKLNVPYELTWSCYEGGDHPCGKCGTCIDRQKAFEENGVKDPLYDD